MSKQKIADLITDIDAITQESLQGNADARLKLLAAAQALCIRLETPFDFVQRVAWQEPSFLMCLKIADDVDLFKHVGPEGSAPKSVEELAESTSMEPKLLKRIARHLAARHVLQASDPAVPSASSPSSANSGTSGHDTSLGFYIATHISAALATSEGSSGIRQTCNIYYPNFLAMPALLKERGYTTPTDNRDGPFQRRLGLVGSTTFECMQLPEQRPLAEDFNLLMKFTTQGRRSFLDVCDVGQLLRARPYLPPSQQRERKRRADSGESAGENHSDGGDVDEEGYLFVDVGGGTGTDALAFQARFPDMTGKVELQELPAVIEAVASASSSSSSSHNIFLRAHDFFQQQPVHGSRFYFMGSVLHDWPDTDATRILQQLAAAMERGYSTLLLSENVLADSSQCHPHLSAIDLTMMTSLASQERSERDWAELLGSAGLKIVRVHTVPSSLKSVIECELA